MKQSKNGLIIIACVVMLVGALVLGSFLLMKDFAVPGDSDAAKESFLTEELKVQGSEWLQGMFYNKFRLTLEEGRELSVYEILRSHSHYYVILLHPFNSGKDEMLIYAKEYFERGYHVYIPDFGGHGESTGTYSGFGKTEQEEVQKLCEYIASMDENAKIVLHGVSLGAAAAIMAAGEPELPFPVEAVIADSAYDTAETFAEYYFDEKYGLLSGIALPVSSLGMRIFRGFFYEDASAYYQIHRCKIPLLLVYGAEDEVVSAQKQASMYEYAICQKELLLIPEAGHAEGVSQAPKDYWEGVTRFLETYVEAK